MAEMKMPKDWAQNVVEPLKFVDLVQHESLMDQLNKLSLQIQPMSMGYANKISLGTSTWEHAGKEPFFGKSQKQSMEERAYDVARQQLGRALMAKLYEVSKLDHMPFGHRESVIYAMIFVGRDVLKWNSDQINRFLDGKF